MTWLENLFSSFWVLIGALALIALVLLVATAAFMCAAVLYGTIRKMLSKEPSREKLLNTAEATAVSLYRLKPDESHVTAFVQGADYMWEHLHPNKK